MITLRTSNDKTVAYLEPCKQNGALHLKLAEAGAFFERKSQESITVPLSTENSQILRRSLTGMQVSIDPDTVQTLAHFADSSENIEAFNVLPSVLDGKAVIDGQDLSLSHYSELRSALNLINDNVEISNGVFLVETENLPQLCMKMKSLKIPGSIVIPNLPEDPFAGISDEPRGDNQDQSSKDSHVTPKNGPNESSIQPIFDVKQEPVKLPDLPPFSGFDGSLASLKWIPLDAYEHIRKDAEKTSKANRRISNSNKTAKTKKKMQRSLLQKLTSFGIRNAFDVLHTFPLRHIDRSKPKLVRQLEVGADATVLGVVDSTLTNNAKRFIRISFEDMVGDKFSVTFFQQMYLAHMYKKGDHVLVTGKFSPFRGMPSFANGKIDKLGSDRGSVPMIPVYGQSEKQELSTWDMLAMVKETLGRLGGKELQEPFDNELLEKYNIPNRAEAYMEIHLPSSPESFKDANRRLVYDELFRLQLMIQKQRQDIVHSLGISQNAIDKPTLDAWRSSLPYDLTGAQERAIVDIGHDMESTNPMYRLVQGDVGSGKTVLAQMAVLSTLDNGHQAALMAPTEILAEQLFHGILEAAEGRTSPRTGGLINIVFLGGKTTAAKARKIRENLKNGSIDIAVGTHALITDDTKFDDLATVVIDEQHRFGVEQRTKLRESRSDGKTPDMLFMTATPIPRSSAMVLYGDLDLTILNELPPGRTPIETMWDRRSATDAVNDWTLAPWDDIRNEVRKGHQAYVVASLVEDNEKLAAQSVTDAYEKLSSSIFPNMKLGMVHGKQKRPEREEIMKQFAAGEIDVLVATTVIEVGVNVPNSTVMVVLDPGRFGIAQLHQIRGRVGRSKLPSRCWLVGETKTEDGEFRLNALVESTDGFYLSEKDLELRKEGTLFSTKQSGQSDLFLANIHQHMNVLETAKNDVQDLLKRDPKLTTLTGKIFLEEKEEIFGENKIKS